MQAKGKKFISLFLVFSFLSLSGNLIAKEKRGADLIIHKKDGQQVRGELIVVKENSLLLLDSESGADVSVDIEDVLKITIVKKSWKGILIGAGIGALVGGLYTLKWGWGELKTEGGSYIAYFSFGGVPGGLVGAGIGALFGVDKTIQIEEKTEVEIREILEKLRSKARVTDYQ